MALFKKKLIEVEAVQFRLDDPATHTHVNFGWPEAPGVELPINNRHYVGVLGAVQIVHDGDWIVTGPDGLLTVYAPDVFARCFEAV